MRKLVLVAAIAVFVLGTIVWIATDRRVTRHAYDELSALNTSDSGFSLGYAYLARTGRKVATLTHAIGHAKLEPNAVVLSAVVHPATFLLTKEEAAFVRGGGRIVVGSMIQLAKSQPSKATKVFPIWKGLDSFEVGNDFGKVDMSPERQALFVAGEVVVLARQRIGAGEIFYLSAPAILRNDRLGSGNHLELLAALVGTGRPVYFDEVAHGLMTDLGALDLMQEWNLGPFLLLILITTAIAVWRHGKRIGPPEDDYRETRSEAVDLVRSLGALYQRGTSDAQALALYHDALVRSVAAQTGLRGQALHRRVDDLTSSLSPPKSDETVDAAELRRQLDILNEAFRRLRPHDRPTKGMHAHHR